MRIEYFGDLSVPQTLEPNPAPIGSPMGLLDKFLMFWEAFLRVWLRMAQAGDYATHTDRLAGQWNFGF
jgi:hypothetical protein